ncbi:uncharacterized protein J3D65DRAFT_425061 [Phyllosticta citribraziliensis]|uniref:Uncharacterized protein n=1 Tax=Phyllosticta citribraziliensis TaxID=989973 RepID=A0ABR1LJV5_9PEZI
MSTKWADRRSAAFGPHPRDTIQTRARPCDKINFGADIWPSSAWWPSGAQAVRRSSTVYVLHGQTIVSTTTAVAPASHVEGFSSPPALGVLENPGPAPPMQSFATILAVRAVKTLFVQLLVLLVHPKASLLFAFFLLFWWEFPYAVGPERSPFLSGLSRSRHSATPGLLHCFCSQVRPVQRAALARPVFDSDSSSAPLDVGVAPPAVSLRRSNQMEEFLLRMSILDDASMVALACET